MKYTLPFTMPTWQTVIRKRIRKITLNQVLDVVVMILFFIILILFMSVPIILALYTPPTVEFSGW
jgi:hypothetical protein